MKRKRKQVYNPFLPLNEYIPDGEPHVFGGRIYLFGSHDRFGGDRYCMEDYVCYSADVLDLTNWRLEGVIYRKKQDPRNPDGRHCLWAPDVVQGPDGRYYLYYCLDSLPEIGVAVSDCPEGPYEYLNLVKHSDGTALGAGEEDDSQFDPGVFIDDNGEIYLYSGNAPRSQGENPRKRSQVMRLCSDMVTLRESPRPLIPDIRNSAGTGFEGHEFFEASSVRKVGSMYYFVYSDIQSNALCHAVSLWPDKEYRFGQQIIALGDTGYRGRGRNEALNFTGNIHGGMENIAGQWYIFYHRHTNRTQFSRQACAEKITILPDGSIPQVEMTSCGLNIGPLAGEGKYPAAIACNLRGKDGAVFSLPENMTEKYPYITQEKSHQYIANMRDGAEASFKYFYLEENTRVSVLVRGKAVGKIRIRLGKEGREAGEIKIETDTREWTEYTAPLEVRHKDRQALLSFIYEGNGAVDFKEFKLEVSKCHSI